MYLAAAADDSATGKPFIVRPGVCEEREDAGTRGGGERGVDEDEIKMRVEGGAEVAGLGVEDRGGGARAVEAEDGGAGRMHWFLGMGWDGGEGEGEGEEMDVGEIFTMREREQMVEKVEGSGLNH